MDVYYIDGEFVDDEKAVVSAKDITVLRGYGVFDFLITYNKRPFFVEEHVARLENSAGQIGLVLGHTNQDICKIVVQTIGKNPLHTESNIRIIYTGGTSPDGVTPQGNGILMVMVTPKFQLPPWWYTDGTKIITVDMERFIPTSKTTNYLSAVFAQQKAHKTGAVEAIYKDRKNRLLEGTTTNLFCFKGDRLITPPDNILPGVTRRVVLDLTKDKYKLELRHVDADELNQMDEIFITASNKEIVPVIQVDDLRIGTGKPGDKTAHVMALFKAYTQAYGQGDIA
ncbi:MAG: aminotransferase class IV [Proteobacteria bacterium]|nr:branched-chain amino acid aminotransferase [Desulfobacula sp.]MBU3951984.1 aminotransferase class IV [Pseudomonadota bacterium]MBU4133258.1 aminotransferase class IV [Pseudomonadota bacterium]